MSPGLTRHSSTTRIILVTLATFAMVIVLSAVIFYQMLRRDIAQLVFSQQFSTVSLLANRIDRHFREQLAVLEAIAGQIVAGNDFLPVGQIQTSLDNRVHLKRFFNGGLMVLDADATVLVESSRPYGRQGVNYSDSKHYQRLFAENRQLIGPVLIGRQMRVWIVPVSVPVRGEDGHLIGVLTGVIDLAAENNFLNEATRYYYGSSGGFLIADLEVGRIIAATDRERIFQPIPPPGVNPVHDRFVAGFEGSGIALSHGGVEHVGSGARVPITNWLVVSILPAAEALAPAYRIGRRISWAGLAILLLAGGLIAWFIKRQLDPLVETADTLDAMTAGRKSLSPLPVTRTDEVGRLLTSFNRLFVFVQAGEEKFRSLAETSIDLIFRLSADGLITYCSPAARKIMGREPERMVGTDFRRHIAPEDLGKVEQGFITAIQGENVRLWDLTLRRGDGSTFVGEINIAPIREDGRITGVQGVVRDVTRRRQAAATLAHQFMFQKMVADISALFVKPAADDLDRAIERALALSGSFFQVDRAYVFLYAPDQSRMNNTHEWGAAGISLQKERIQDVPRDAFPWLAERLAAGKPVQIPEVALLPPEAGAERAEFNAQEIKSLLLFPLHGPERPIGFMGYDSVRRLRFWTDEEIGLLKVVAEIIGNALIRGEVEAELRRKSVELARSNAELTDFAYIASHDLQEPLRKISAFGDRLQSKYEAVLDEKGKDYLARMQNAALRMEQMINDLLSYSRVTTKARPMAPVALNEVLDEVLDTLECTRKELAAEIEIGQLPLVMADRGQMYSLFQNLLGNALKYHRPGVAPRIRVEADPPQGGRVMIRVSDNGIGLEEKYAERIFRPFQRLHGRSEYPGSGIGLAICKKIVERHHGEIKVQSTPGQGAVFSVILPWRPQS